MSVLPLRAVLVASLLLQATIAHALGPHEIALLINRNSPASVELAHHFAHDRKVPPQNIIYLSLPDGAMEPEAQITPEEFTKHIWEPANADILKRKIGDHILAWVYSADFPVRILSEPNVSLQGITFVRNKLPDPESITQGTYASRIYAGPDKEGGPYAESRTLEQYATFLQGNAPLPSMMLAHLGSRGTTMEEALTSLKYGVISDGSSPRGNVYLIKIDDVRSQCRSWEFPDAQEEINKLGLTCVIASNYPTGVNDLVGVMGGSQNVDPATYGTYVPGAMGEHLTSYGAIFHFNTQSKLTTWLRAGATASAGTVVEPFAIWTKFPHARFYAHYARGCTILESFYQSIRCPMQTLLVGEPLAAPWKKASPITLIGLEDEDKPLTGMATFVVSSLFPSGEEGIELLYLLDGRSMANYSGNKQELKFDTKSLADGYHELRAVAYAKGDVRHQSFATLGFETRNRDRHVTLSVEDMTGDRQDLYHTIKLRFKASGNPKELAIILNERVAVKGIPPTNDVVELDPRAFGAGPVSLQAVALYEDQEAVRSRPVPLLIAEINRAPVVESVDAKKNDDAKLVWSATAKDPEGDPVSFEWLEKLTERDLEGMTARGGKLKWKNAGIELTSSAGSALALFGDGLGTNILELSATALAPFPYFAEAPHAAGLVFNATSETNFDYFMLSGDTMSWSIGRVEDGVPKASVARGTLFANEQPIRLSIRHMGEGRLRFSIGGRILVDAGGFTWKAPFGLYGGNKTTRYAEVLVQPPYSPGLSPSDDGSLLEDPAASGDRNLIVRATDRLKDSEKPAAKPSATQ